MTNEFKSSFTQDDVKNEKKMNLLYLAQKYNDIPPQVIMPESGTFDTILGGVSISVQYRIYSDHRAKCIFTYLSTLYSFDMCRWKQRNFSDFVTKFHDVYTDVNKFGETVLDANGTPLHTINPDQEIAIVYQAMNDCFRFLDQLVHVQKGKTVDYALWYREKHIKDTSTYAKYIQLVVCHCVVHQQFIAGTYKWDEVKFVPIARQT